MNLKQSSNPLKDKITRLQPDETFTFKCHPQVSCFNDCCRQLDLLLTPYDVMRLKKALQISSAECLDRYAIVEDDPQSVFPAVYLTMVDDGRASCPFVTGSGCRIYADRPGACRIYPLARGSYQTPQGNNELHVLLREPHCHGFAETAQWTSGQWLENQQCEAYNEHNDLLMNLYQHKKVKQGFKLNSRQKELYLTCLYDLDAFRRQAPELTADYRSQSPDLSPPPWQDSDSQLLRYAIQWLQHELLGT